MNFSRLLLIPAIIWGSLSFSKAQTTVEVDFDASKPTVKVEKIVPLETSESCFIDRTFRIKIVDEYIFAQDMSHILIFDRNGKYLSKVKQVGHGPQEYIGIVDFCYHNGELYILPIGGNKIPVYSLQGQFKRSLLLKIPAESFLITDRLRLFKSAASKQGSLIIAGKNGKKILQQIAPVIPQSTFSISALQPLTQTGSQIYYLPDMRSEIYQISPDGTDIQTTCLDFGSHTMTEDYVKRLEQRGFLEKLKKDEVACFLNFHPTREWWGVAFAMGDDSYRWYYRPSDGKQHLEKIAEGSTSKLLACSTADCFVEAADALSFLENLRYASLRDQVSVTETDNPVLIFYSIR